MPNGSEASSFLAETPPTQTEILDQLERILRSQSFRNSTVLHQFLRFVTEKAISGRTSDINEYAIATEVFGRAADFNPAADTIVRTQAYRLRLKLDEYYRREGSVDPTLIEIPKGHYIPTFSPRRHEEVVANPGFPQPSSSEIPAHSSPTEKMSRFRRLGWALLLCCFAFFAGALFERTVLSRIAISSPPATSVDLFWQSFLKSDKQPIVAYTNALYFATDFGDFFSFSGGPVGDRGAVVDSSLARRVLTNPSLATAGPLYFEDDWTGEGDVLASVEVSNALTHAGGHPSFKRGRLLTTYDLDNHNVVFIGSSFVNQVLNDLPNQPKFVFKGSTVPPLLWTSRIEDTLPSHGRPASYRVDRDPGTRVITSDYAVVSELVGLKPDRKILILGGLTTSGTAAAGQFATSPEGIAEMSRRIPRSPNDKVSWPSYFEYLLRVQLSRGLDVVRSECVASHFK